MRYVQARGRFRAWLGAAVAATVLGGLALVSVPATEPASAPAGQPGQPLGAVSPAPPVDRVDDTTANAVDELLRARAEAVLDRDEAAFLATIDPHADEAFVTAQRELFANLDGVGLDEWSYTLNRDNSLNLMTLPDEVTGVGTEREASELWAPAVELRYALRGADVAATGRPMGYLFARYGDEWYLRSDTALDGLGRRTWRGPWDFGPCRVVTTEHGLVLSHPGSERTADRLVAELDSAVRAVLDIWEPSWPRKVAVILPDSPAEMRALVGSGFPVDSVVAVAVADRVDNEARTATGQRVVFSPDGAPALSTTSMRIVLRHEITHVAARTDTVDGSPIWLLEGFADYVGYRGSGVTLAEGAPDLARLVRQGSPPTELPEDRAFRSSGPGLDLAYQQSWSIARYLAERHGEDTLVAVYRTLAGAGAASASDTDRMLRDTIGVDRGQLVRDWQRYLSDELG